MGFWEHLDELRSRAVLCLWIFFGGFLAFYFLSDHILDLLRKPLFDALPADHRKLYYTGLFENFLVHLKVSAYASLAVLSPAYFKILWSFIGPGLKPHERRSVQPFIWAAATFFLLGSAFAYFVLLPVGVRYFLSYGTSAEAPMLTLEAYVDMMMKLLAGFGLCFEIPVIMILLGKLGFLTADQLGSQRKTAIIAIAVLAALVAPPDALSMLILMVPLYLFFESSIWVVRRMELRRAASKSY
jgi:sec-independent protein translocase protein TatC